MIRPLAAAAELHGVPRLLVEDDPEEEDEGALKRETRWAGGVSAAAEEAAELKSSLTCTQLKPANR